MSASASVPTSADVARMAGVSAATVSYVFSGRRGGGSRIAESTCRRVLEAAASLHYVPNQSARALRRQSTERVCLVLPRLGVPYHDLLASELQEVAQEHDYSVVITVSDTPGRRRSAVEQLRRRLADGVVFVGDTVPDEQDLAALVRANIAVTVVSDRVSAAGVDVVRTTTSEACRAAVRYLAAHGHRRIGFIGHFLPESPHNGRYEAYLAGLEDCGLPRDDRIVSAGAVSHAEAYRGAEALFELDERPTAIFAASDIAAVGSIWAARVAGLQVPDDVAVIGVGNIPEDTVIRPSLTSVGPVCERFGDITDLLFSRLQGAAPTEGRVRVQKWDLIRRESA